MDTRHLPALVVLLALACVPTVVHTYVGSTLNDGRSVAAIPLQLAGLSGRPSTRAEGWVLDEYGTSDFIERQFGSDLTLFVARSFDAKSLYHHPELGVAHGDNYDRAVVLRTAGRPDVPVFVLKSSLGRESVYALMYGTEFIEQPMRFQLRNALVLLARPRQLMTLFFVRDKSGGRSSPDSQSLLLAAIDAFVAQPGTATK